MPTNIYVTARDIEILQSVGTARYLTAAGIEWLHFTGWRDRPRLKPSTSVYRRIAGLVTYGYLARIYRHAPTATLSKYSHLPDAYGLTPAGRELLEEHAALHKVAMRPYVVTRPGTSFTTIEHALSVGMLYAALHAQGLHNGIPITDWQCDSTLSHNYDRVQPSAGLTPVSVIPDATFVLASKRIFAELERGTNNPRAITQKIRAYQVYRNNSKLKSRYKVDDFSVVFIAPTQHRLARLAEALALDLQARPGFRVDPRDPKHYDRWYFALAEHIHPHTIQQCQQIAQVRYVSRTVATNANKSAAAEITFRATELWPTPTK